LVVGGNSVVDTLADEKEDEMGGSLLVLQGWWST
jgi:hypothetical protein